MQPVPKKGDRSNLSNYRPIDLVSCLSKAFETIVLPGQSSLSSLPIFLFLFVPPSPTPFIFLSLLLPPFPAKLEGGLPLPQTLIQPRDKLGNEVET